MNLKQHLYDLKNQKQQAVDKAKGFVEAGELEHEDYKSAKALITSLNEQISATEALIAEDAGDAGVEKAFVPADPSESTSYEKAVKSFASAARNGFRVEKAAGDFMQEGVDPDGGYTVPDDIVTNIIKLREAEESLLGEVTVKPVKTRRGRRTYKKRSQHKGFSTVAEAAKFGKTATPQYATMEYDIEKRGGYLPVTNELLEDSDANIAAEAETWLAGEARVTANNEIIAVVKEKEEKDLVDLDGILGAWMRLGVALRSVSKIITNTDGMIWLGTLKDANERYLLTPNPTNPAQMQLCIGPHIIPVKEYDNATIPSDGTKIPMIVGSLKEGVVYWDRRQFSIKVSDVAAVGELNAFEQDLTIWRGSLRDDCTLRDSDAFINGYIDTAAAG